MERKCLAAYTPPGGNYPPYFNVSLVGNKIVVTVRSPAQREDTEFSTQLIAGDCGIIEMDIADWEKIAIESQGNLP